MATRQRRTDEIPFMSHPIVLNKNILEMRYAVRGPIAKRAGELRTQGRRIIPCHIGNPQALGQEPIAYYRRLLSLVEDPSRIEREWKLGGSTPLPPTLSPGDLVAEDLLTQAETILAGLESGTGAYTESNGPRFIREAIARYIDRRDERDGSGAVAADPGKIFLTNGASEGVRFIIEMLIADPKDGVMIPIPQYPLYSATIKKCGGVQAGYYPDEDAGWTLRAATLDESIERARREGVRVKAIVVINPANPTGALLDEESVEDVIRFAERNELVIIADEVYQENVYGGRFTSFAKKLGKREVPLVSLHSTSKGFYGECGHRGGYLELRNPPRVEGTDTGFEDVLLKQASVSLCSNTAGQVLTYLMVSPPPEGSSSRKAFEAQRDRILSDLHEKATMIRGAFEEMEGVRCFGKTGAMYLFPRLEKLPAGSTDFDYCMRLLEETGFCTVNGEGFGQKPGTSHLRIAFLPRTAVLKEALPRWIEFHNAYVRGA